MFTFIVENKKEGVQKTKLDCHPEHCRRIVSLKTQRFDSRDI